MADNSSLYGLGTVDADGNLPTLLGEEYRFDDKDPTGATTNLLSKRGVYARWVKNTSGGTLYACDACNVSSTYPAYGADAGAQYGPFLGFVDPFVSSTGVASNAHFYVIVRGPARAMTDGAGTIAVGDKLVQSATAKRILKSTAHARDYGDCGQSDAVVAATADVKFRVILPG